MFDKAQLCIIADPQIDESNNRFTFDGGSSRAIFGMPNMYKIKEGEHTVMISSGNGEKWEVTAKVKYREMLTIKLGLSGKDITSVQYRVEPAHPMTANIGTKLY